MLHKQLQLRDQNTFPLPQASWPPLPSFQYQKMCKLQAKLQKPLPQTKLGTEMGVQGKTVKDRVLWTATSKTKLIYFYKNSETAQNLRVCSLVHQPNICIRTDWQIWSLQFFYNGKMPVLGVFSYIHTDVCEFILQQAAGFKRCNFYLEGKLCFLCLLGAHFSFRMNYTERFCLNLQWHRQCFHTV